MKPDLFLVEDAVWVLSAPTEVAIYDFPFEPLLACRRPARRPDVVVAAARIGAFDDYARQAADLAADGVVLVNSTEEHLRATRLPRWYPLLEDLTPRSAVFDHRPSAREVEAAVGWPAFLKGERQTSRHRRALSLAESPDDLERLLDAWERDAILGWQQVVAVCVPLRPVIDPSAPPERLPPRFELRTFWWRGALVGCGRYWWDVAPCEPTAAERRAALEVAREAARRAAVPFLVVDVAETAAGEWIVIELNDAQESGYAGVHPLALWQAIVQEERARPRDRRARPRA